MSAVEQERSPGTSRGGRDEVWLGIKCGTGVSERCQEGLATADEHHMQTWSTILYKSQELYTHRKSSIYHIRLYNSWCPNTSQSSEQSSIGSPSLS